jgi:hypothetical protein
LEIMRKLAAVFQALAGLFLLLLLAGRWRSSGVGPQVQVPMFYDAHYLFPRPWTQAQEAPGVPPPAPLSALYGPNRVTQSFIAGADRLSMLEVWLAGPVGTLVEATLALPDGTTYGGEIELDDPAGRFYRLTFPAVPAAKGQRFILTLAAPEAEESRPVTTRSIGGDRLGGAIRLNEYSLPGNLELYTYSQGGLPGRWWAQAVGEQLLPSLFRLRLQQYKPPAFKGPLFAGLLLVTVGLTAVFLVLARPGRQSLGRAVTWAGVLLLGSFLAWQVGSGRVWLPWPAGETGLQPLAQPLAIMEPAAEARLVQDFSLTLWTAVRVPEERFISTDFVQTPEGYLSALRVPADSEVRYTLTIPPQARLRTGLQVAGEGALRFWVQVGEEEIASQVVPAGGDIAWLDLPLQPYAGWGTVIRLGTENVEGRPEGLWLQPRLLSDSDWLLADAPEEATLVDYRFGPAVQLLAYDLEPADPRPGEAATVTLYWQTSQPLNEQATVFVHLLDEAGQIVAQDDAQPVRNSYPLPVWPPGMVISDTHPLIWPDRPGALTVGLYNPADFSRWPVRGAEGVELPDGRVILQQWSKP